MTLNQGTAILTHGVCHINFHFSEKKNYLLFLEILSSEFIEKIIYTG